MLTRAFGICERLASDQRGAEKRNLIMGKSMETTPTRWDGHIPPAVLAETHRLAGGGDKRMAPGVP